MEKESAYLLMVAMRIYWMWLRCHRVLPGITTRSTFSIMRQRPQPANSPITNIASSRVVILVSHSVMVSSGVPAYDSLLRFLIPAGCLLQGLSRILGKYWLQDSSQYFRTVDIMVMVPVMHGWRWCGSGNGEGLESYLYHTGPFAIRLSQKSMLR